MEGKGAGGRSGTGTVSWFAALDRGWVLSHGCPLPRGAHRAWVSSVHHNVIVLFRGNR